MPITLSVVYVELGRRLGLKLEGVGLPGHFVVRHLPKKGEPQLIDAYEGGKPLSRAEAAKKVEDITGEKLEDRFLTAVTPRDVIVHMLNNLLRIAQKERDFKGPCTTSTPSSPSCPTPPASTVCVPWAATSSATERERWRTSIGFWRRCRKALTSMASVPSVAALPGRSSKPPAQPTAKPVSGRTSAG